MPKLREYNGVVYKDGEWYNEHGLSYRNVFQALSIFFEDAVDEDHIALLDLKNNPYEPIQTLEDVVELWHKESGWHPELCVRLRTWMAQSIHDEGLATIGAKNEQYFHHSDMEPTREEQVQYHVDALIRMGAKYYPGELPLLNGYPRLVLPKVK